VLPIRWRFSHKGSSDISRQERPRWSRWSAAPITTDHEDAVGTGARVKGGLSSKDRDSKALGAIALAKGEHSEARECLTRDIAVLDRRPPSGLIAAERVRTIELLRRSSSAEGI
jgi:hypothetical protein